MGMSAVNGQGRINPQHTPEMREYILEKLIEGMTLLDVSRLDGAPNRRTIARWAESDKDFGARLAASRKVGAEIHASKALSVLTDVKLPDDANPAVAVKLAAETSKVHRWRAAVQDREHWADNAPPAVVANGENVVIIFSGLVRGPSAGIEAPAEAVTLGASVSEDGSAARLPAPPCGYQGDPAIDDTA